MEQSSIPARLTDTHHARAIPQSSVTRSLYELCSHSSRFQKVTQSYPSRRSRTFFAPCDFLHAFLAHLAIIRLFPRTRPLRCSAIEETKSLVDAPQQLGQADSHHRFFRFEGSTSFQEKQTSAGTSKNHSLARSVGGTFIAPVDPLFPQIFSRMFPSRVRA